MFNKINLYIKRKISFFTFREAKLVTPTSLPHCMHERVYIVPLAENSVVMFKVLGELST